MANKKIVNPFVNPIVNAVANVATNAGKTFSDNIFPKSAQKTQITNTNTIVPNVTWGGYDVLPNFKDTSWMNEGRNRDDAGYYKDYKDIKDAGLKVPSSGSGTPSSNNGGGGGGGGYGYIPTYNPYARYASPYQGKIDVLMNALLNRDPFSYDYLSDPVYQSYRQQYEFQGDRARENAIGDYAANTGGLASSWANTRGQLRQNNYNAQLNGLIPELENARYNRYLGEIETDLNNLGQLQNLESRNYDRFLNERNYDLQLQQLRNSALSRRSSGSKTSGNDALMTDYNAYMVAQDIKNGGEMPSMDAMIQMNISPSKVLEYVNDGSTGGLLVGGNSSSNQEDNKKKSSVLDRIKKFLPVL